MIYLIGLLLTLGVTGVYILMKMYDPH